MDKGKRRNKIGICLINGVDEKKRVGVVVLFCLFCAGLALLPASTSSPLYATNFWTDSNIYFTIGRGMIHGLVPYRDLFDHKGPLIFMIYAVGALLSEKSFLGVYFLEVISLALTLLLTYKIVRLHCSSATALLAVPIMAAFTVSCTAFNQGGSAEEFCLPALTFILYAAMRLMDKQVELDRSREQGLLFGFGLATGWIFMIKFTICGLALGLGSFMLVTTLYCEGASKMLWSLLWLAIGFFVICAVPIVYLLLNHTLILAFDIYFIQNIFEYGDSTMSFKEHLYNAAAYFRTQGAINQAVRNLTSLGCFGALLYQCMKKERGFILKALSFSVSAGVFLLGVYWGSIAHPYYAIVFAPLMTLGLCSIGVLMERGLKLAQKPAILLVFCSLSTILLIPFVNFRCQAWPLHMVKRDEMAQTRFAQILEEKGDGTLLDLTSHDQGFYLASGRLPSFRYFIDNNLDTQEKRESINGYLKDARPDYVVCWWRDPGENYSLIAEETSPFDLNDLRTYKLYERKADNENGLGVTMQ